MRLVRRLCVPLLILALLTAAVWGWHWWRHPTVFDGGPVSGVSASPQPLARATLYATVALPSTATKHRERITFNDAQANYSPNSVPVTSTFEICTVAKDSPPLGVSNTTTPEEFCESVRPLRRGTEFDYNPHGTEQIVLTMRPSRPGAATLTSIDLDYSRTWGHGGQSGVQHIPEYFKLTAR